MDLLSKIQLNRNSLTKNEAKACDAIMNDMMLVQHNSLAELSEKIGVTKTSILRFCQKLGYSGYSEFKYDLISYVNSLHSENESMENTITTVEQLYANAIGLIHHTVKEEDLQVLAEEIRKAGKVVVSGIVNSSVAAMQLRYALLMYGIDATPALSETDLKILDMSMDENDLLIVYSVSADSEVMKPAFNLKEQSHCHVALITMNKDTVYKEKSDHFFCLPDIGVPEKSLLQGIPIFTVFNEILLNYIERK